MIALNEAWVSANPVNNAFGASQALDELDLVESALRFAEAMAPAALAVVANFSLDDSAAFDGVHARQHRAELRVPWVKCGAVRVNRSV